MHPKPPSSYETPTSSSGSSDSGLPPGVPRNASSSGRPFREERAKWGDRGVTVGHYYDALGGSGESSVSLQSSVDSGAGLLLRGGGVVAAADPAADNGCVGPVWLARGVQHGRSDTESGL